MWVLNSIRLEHKSTDIPVLLYDKDYKVKFFELNLIYPKIKGH